MNRYTSTFLLPQDHFLNNEKWPHTHTRTQPHAQPTIHINTHISHIQTDVVTNTNLHTGTVSLPQDHFLNKEMATHTHTHTHATPRTTNYEFLHRYLSSPTRPFPK